ncbi:MAG: transglutaminase domain-containing protein [Tissierellia bacterium]|nr:transglutaminase domain-containing protein [Tissierellia bacterium]
MKILRRLIIFILIISLLFFNDILQSILSMELEGFNNIFPRVHREDVIEISSKYKEQVKNLLAIEKGETSIEVPLATISKEDSLSLPEDGVFEDPNLLKEYLVEQLINLEEVIVVRYYGDLTMEDLMEIGRSATEDSQVLEGYKGGNIHIEALEKNKTMTIESNFKMTKEEKAQINEFIRLWVAQNISQEMGDEEKVKSIHDFIILQNQYNEGDENHQSAGYSVYSPGSILFGEGGVCEAYAYLFYKMALATGLEAIVVRGIAQPDSESSGFNHAWNMVKVDNIWYYIDLTWDDPVTKDGRDVLRYDYYLKSNEYMSTTRTWNKEEYPPAPYDYPHNYIQKIDKS